MSEKTEQPTPKKLQDARKKGNVAYSREVGSVLTYVTALAILGTTAAAVSSVFRRLYLDVVKAAAQDQAVPVALGGASGDALDAIFRASAVFLGAVAVTGLAAGIAQTGFILSAEPLIPKLDKINPLKKLKQWFSMQGLFEFAKTLVKLLLVFLLAWVTLRGALAVILRLGMADVPAIYAVTTSTARSFLLAVALGFAALAFADLGFQRWRWKKDLMMTKDEVKREYKEQEGDPEIKGHRKAIHQEMLSQDVQAAVAGADVVTVNPTHLAVALRYRKEEMRAPRVVAKGQRQMAAKIVAWAKKNEVPIVRDITLTRALFELQVEDHVPRDLYAAVAEVLTFAAKLRQESQRAAG
jgi:type III secretion YscU/HrpY family protein